jgi:hypothetical protein
MATKPLRDEPSVPDIEHSERENIQELRHVLVLRTAKSLILPLQIPDQWEEQPCASAPPTRSIEASPVMAFKATTHVLDPGTQRTHTLILSIAPGIDDGSANLFLQSDSIRNEGGWRAYLYRGTALRASVSFADENVALDRAMSPDIYTIKLTSVGAPVLPALTIALAPFNLPEALQAGETYLASRQYIRAEAVLSETAKRYPENADAQDLLMLAGTLAAADPAAYQEEQAEFGVFRSAGSMARQASRAFQEARLKFGERVGTLIAGKTLDKSEVSYAAIPRSAEATVSTAVLRSLMLLKEKLEVQKSTENQPLLRVLGVIASRQQHLEVLNGELTKNLDAVRSDAQATDDEKFALAEQLLQRYTDEIAESQIVSQDYMPFFREQVGEACWNWLGVDVQRVCNTAEEFYRYQEGKPPSDLADFTPAVLEICRGFEELLNDRLGRFCKNIQDAINGNSDCTDTALKDVSEDTLNGLLKPERSMSMGKIGTILRLGRLIHAARPKTFDPKLEALLTFSPGPADIEQVVFLNYIAAELRNGKVHSSEYTSPHGMRLARKLVLGLDETRVGYSSIRGWIEQHPRFKKNVEVRKKLAATWVEFPGIVPSLWRALEATAAASAA